MRESTGIPTYRTFSFPWTIYRSIDVRGRTDYFARRLRRGKPSNSRDNLGMLSVSPRSSPIAVTTDHPVYNETVSWLDQLKHDPIEQLRNTRNAPIVHFVERDLLDQPKKGDELWDLPEARKIVRRQRDDGSWEYPGGDKRLRSQTHYDQIETYRYLGFLVEKYDFNKSYRSIRRAADFLFSFQTTEGDFRGIYGNQYTPNYSAGITELLIKAGYRADRRIRRSLKWLLSIRQGDGGWAIPFRTRGRDLGAITDKKTIQPDMKMPSSWLVTGVVLRAFAVDPEYRQLPEVIAAGRLLICRFFRRDSYPDRQAPSFWTRFAFPFWFTDLVSSLDSLSRLGFNCEETRIQEGLRWFRDQQREDGSWNLKLLKKGDKQLHLWLALSICRVFRRFYSSDLNPTRAE